MVEEEPGGRTPQRIMQCTDHEYIKDGQLEMSMGGPHPKQELNGGVIAELAIGAADRQDTGPQMLKAHQNNVAVYVKSVDDSNITLYVEGQRSGCKDVKDEQNQELKHQDKCKEDVTFDSKTEYDKNNKPNNKAVCVNGHWNNKTESAVPLTFDHEHEKHEEEMQEKKESRKEVNNSCEKDENETKRGEQAFLDDSKIDTPSIKELDEHDDGEENEEDQCEVIMCNKTQIDEDVFVKSEDTVGISIQPRNKPQSQDGLEKCDKTKDVPEEKVAETIDTDDRNLPTVQTSTNQQKRQLLKRKRRRNRRSKRNKKSPQHIEKDDIRCKGKTKETMVYKACVPGIVNTAGGSADVKTSNNSNANKHATGTGSRRQSTKRQQSGNGGVNGGGGGGGCGGEPPTPHQDWKEKLPCDGPVVNKDKKRRPSKRLVMRQDSHSSLPSPISHGPPYIHNKSPCFSLPPTGALPTYGLVMEDFIPPAFDHFQSESSAARWLTHTCPPCKTMHTYCNHVRKCQEEQWHTCTICSKLFDAVMRHVSLCQQSRQNECGMPFCQEFFMAASNGKEAQFQILFQFAASFDDPGPNFTQPIGYPIQREQSLTENALGTDIPAIKPRELDVQFTVAATGEPTQTVSRGMDFCDGLEKDSSVSSTESSHTSEESPDERQQSEATNLQDTPNQNAVAGHPRYMRPRQQCVPVTDVNMNAFIDHLTNKQYHTRQQLEQDDVSQQEPLPTALWREEEDEPEPIRNKVRYGENRHLRAFLPIWERLQQELTGGHVMPDDKTTDYEEGVLFETKGLHVVDGHYTDGDQYVCMGSLGTGAFGKVYLCKDHNTGFEFVVKKIDLMHYRPDEALLWSKMDHPGIVKLLGVVRTGSTICFFSEYVANRTLKSLVQNGRVLSQGDALYYVDQLLWILEYVHDMRVVHKDLKPENVLVTGEGRLLLIDWGLAKVMRQQYIESEQFPEGTQHYMSPEVACSERYDFGVDIWSLMCVGIHLISGYPPWAKRFGNVRYLFYKVGTESPPLEDIPEDTHPEVKALLESGLTVEPSDRPNAAQLLQHSAFGLICQLQGIQAVSRFQTGPSELDIAQCASPGEGEWAPHFAPATDDVDVNISPFPASCLTGAATYFAPAADVDVNISPFPTSCLTGAMIHEPGEPTHQNAAKYGQDWKQEFDWQRMQSNDSPPSHQVSYEESLAATTSPPQPAEFQPPWATSKQEESSIAIPNMVDDIMMANGNPPLHHVASNKFLAATTSPSQPAEIQPPWATSNFSTSIPHTQANQYTTQKSSTEEESMKMQESSDCPSSHQVASDDFLAAPTTPLWPAEFQPPCATSKQKGFSTAIQNKDDVMMASLETTHKPSTEEDLESIKMPEFSFDGLPNLANQSLSNPEETNEMTSNNQASNQDSSSLSVAKVNPESSAIPFPIPTAASCVSDVSTQLFNLNLESPLPSANNGQKFTIRDEVSYLKHNTIQSFGSIPMTSIGSLEDLYGPSPIDDTDVQPQYTAPCSSSPKLNFLQDSEGGKVSNSYGNEELAAPVPTNGHTNCSPENDFNDSKVTDCAQIPVPSTTTEISTGEYIPIQSSVICPLMTTNQANSNTASADPIPEPTMSQSLCTPRVASQNTPDASLPGRLHKPRKRPSIKLAPVFSEAAATCPARDPMPVIQTSTDGQQTKQLNPQERETVPDSSVPIAMQLQDFDDHDDLPATMQPSQQLTTDGAKASFLNDEDDFWRFQGLEALSGGVSDIASSSAESPPRNSSTGASAPDEAYMTAFMTSQLDRSASNISADDLEQEYLSLAASTLMQQASGIESPEDQLKLFSEAMELRSHVSQHSSYSNHGYNPQTGASDIPVDRPSIEFAAAGTSGIYTASPLRSFSPMVSSNVERSIATLQKQLSTISSTSSNGAPGVKVCVIGDGFNCISIQMRREQTIGDLARGISAKVPNEISKFTLQTEEGLLLNENQAICCEMTLVLIPAPDDGTWQWRVSCSTGQMDYSDDYGGAAMPNTWS